MPRYTIHHSTITICVCYVLAALCLLSQNSTFAQIHNGAFSLSPKQVKPGDAFDFDLTPHLKQGANVIALFVSMEKIPAVQPMGEAVTVNLTASKVRSLSKGMFGPFTSGFDNRSYDLHGIWQPVRLVIRGSAK